MRVLLLAATTGYQTRSFEEAADRLGIDLVYATDRCHTLDDPWQDQAIPIRFYEPDASIDAIVSASGRRPFDGILAVGDRPTLIAAGVARALGLPGHPPSAALAASHKLLTRERLKQDGLSVPWFLSVAVDADPHAITPSIRFPCVVKPLALSGSRGVMRANTAEEWLNAFERLRALLRSRDVKAERNEAHDAVLIEGFIPGREFALEGVLHHGVLQALALFDKPDPLDGPLFEETIYVTPSRASADEQGAIVAAVSHAIRALDLWHGPIHAECRVNEEGVFVIEVAARPIGGLCARTLRFRPSGESSGQPLISLEELLLRQATGESPAGWTRERLSSGVMMIPIPRRGVLRAVAGTDEARSTPHVDEVRITAKIDQLLVPLPEGASYLGFIFATAEQQQDVERALRASHGQIHFTIDPEIPVYNRSHG